MIKVKTVQLNGNASNLNAFLAYLIIDVNALYYYYNYHIALFQK